MENHISYEAAKRLIDERIERSLDTYRIAEATRLKEPSVEDCAEVVDLPISVGPDLADRIVA